MADLTFPIYPEPLLADPLMSQSTFSQQLQYQSLLLDRSQQEILSLRRELQASLAASHEVIYLKSQLAEMRQVQEQLKMLLSTQEANIDVYEKRTQTFYNNANTELIAVKKAYSDLERKHIATQSKLVHAVSEIKRSHSQLSLSEEEISKLRSQLQEAVYVSEEAQFLRGQLAQSTAESSKLSHRLFNASSQLRFLKSKISTELLNRDSVQTQLEHELQLISEEIEIAQTQMRFTTHEAEKFMNLFQRASLQMENMKVALISEKSANNYVRGKLAQESQKSQLIIEELERVVGDPTVSQLSSQLAQADAEIFNLRNIIVQYQTELDSLRKKFSPPRLIEGPAPILSPPEKFEEPRKFAYFGVEVAEGSKLKNKHGEIDEDIRAVRVVNVGGPCILAGLQPDDLITSIQGKRVSNLEDFNSVVSQIEPGSEVKVIFEREGALLGTDVLTGETLRQPGLPSKTREVGPRSEDVAKPSPPRAKGWKP